MITERVFQSRLIKKLKRIFLSCYILKNDANYLQGIPDILILYKNKWAMLECKAGKNSSLRPNQKWHIEHLNDMSYCKIISPENEEEILEDLKKFFK